MNALCRTDAKASKAFMLASLRFYAVGNGFRESLDDQRTELEDDAGHRMEVRGRKSIGIEQQAVAAARHMVRLNRGNPMVLHRNREREVEGDSEPWYLRASSETT